MKQQFASTLESSSSIKKRKTSTYEDVALLKWMSQERSKNVLTSGPITAAKAKQIFESVE